jgi:Nucleotidyl transferase AbiEii toxin, Type IV TA system
MKRFDQRVVPAKVLELLRHCRQEAPFHLGGGAVLSGVHLGHRLSSDVDVFCHDLEDVRRLVRALPDIAQKWGEPIRIVRDSRTYVRCELPQSEFAMDLVYESLVDLAPPEEVEGIATESLLDLRASKLTCLLSRAEPRYLVDIWMLEQAGFAPEQDLKHALEKDAGIDPATLAWLLKDFPLAPLPKLLVELTPATLRTYRDELAERFARLASMPG